MSDSTSSEPLKAPTVDLPHSITLLTFTAARIKEFQAMKNALNETTGVKMAFQKLPKHMRRRAMSHNVKRLPRRLREIHSSQMKKSGLPPKSKRPSRSYRRRPHNLVSDYTRRKRRIKWLDTHIWHAKRFHMVEKWGYKLPYRPCDKSFKACYRATTQHCLIQDISYNRCIEISGRYQKIVECLAKLIDSKIGLTFGAKCYSEGKKFGEVQIFEPVEAENQFRKAIGQVEFLWNTKNSDQNRQLWIFVHPAFYKQFLETLLAVFNLESTNMETKDEVAITVPTYEGSDGIVLKELQYEISKFRLTGPLSTAVLKNALRLVDFNEWADDVPSWCKNFDLAKLTEQNKTYKDIGDLSLLPSNMVMSIIVHDPRFNFPKKRTKALPTILAPDNDNFDALQQNASLSPLWNGDVRKYVKDNKVPNVKILDMRSQLLVPGTDLDEKGELIPIILLWRTGIRSAENNGYSSGWDIILPSSWAQSFFLSFIMWGARAGGLRETESIAFEKSHCDILYPDTAAGETEENHISEKFSERFFKLPPNKRTNFNKFGIVSPITFNWKILLKDWTENSSNCDNFFVIRNRAVLRTIQEFLTAKSKTTVIPLLPENCLIPVKVTPVKKGVCSKFNIICIPKKEDFETEPEEPKRKDLLAGKRKQMREEHKVLLKRFRKRRKRAKESGRSIIKPNPNFYEDYKEKMRKLWLPETETIKTSCARDIMGFVKHGDFSFTLGQSKGLGYIVGSSLKTLTTVTRRNMVLLRNTNSRQYRLAVLEVIL